MGELGRYGPQLPHDEAAQREHFNEVDEDFRRDQEADSVAKGHSTRPRLRIGYLVVLAGAAGFVASCFVPYYGFGPGFETVSLYQRGSGSHSVGWDLGSLLFLFGGVAPTGNPLHPHPHPRPRPRRSGTCGNRSSKATTQGGGLCPLRP
jgi:hypothetical protein